MKIICPLNESFLFQHKFGWHLSALKCTGESHDAIFYSLDFFFHQNILWWEIFELIYFVFFFFCLKWIWSMLRLTPKNHLRKRKSNVFICENLINKIKNKKQLVSCLQYKKEFLLYWKNRKTLVIFSLYFK